RRPPRTPRGSWAAASARATSCPSRARNHEDRRGDAPRQGAPRRHRRLPVQRVRRGSADRGRPRRAPAHRRGRGRGDALPRARLVVEQGGIDALVVVGAVIRGGTPHFEYVADAVARGVAELSRSAKIPVTFGVLTCDTVEQAIDRAGAKSGNKGFDAAMAAIE